MGLFGLGREKARTPEQIVATVDLARGMVCELGRTDDRAAVERRLGRPTKSDKVGLSYDQIGLHVAVAKAGTITGWSIFFSPTVTPHWTWGERRITRPPAEADVLALLGAPAKRETDEEELMLMWERGSMTILVDYALDGTLNDVMVDYE